MPARGILDFSPAPIAVSLRRFCYGSSDMRPQIFALLGALGTCAISGAGIGAPAMDAGAGVIVIDDRNVYPESLDAAPDGTLYIGGSTGRIYRAGPGSRYAEPWILKEDSGLHDGIRGVLVDKARGQLWVCDNEGRESWIVRFALGSGRKLGSQAFPGGGHCNDISLKGDAAYMTDTSKGRILKMPRSGGAPQEWFTADPADRSLDGLVWTRDGTLYTNTYSSHHLIRVGVNPDGSAGKATVLKPSQELFQPDGMRLAPDGTILLVEGGARPGAGLKEGRLDRVTVEGDRAKINVIATGFELPTAVTTVGRTAWVLESKFDYLRNPALKGQDPGSFHIRAVVLRR
jgi:sugar lactone lactonase YvrE